MKVTFGQGLNADALSNEMGEGFVNDCTNMRFRKEFAEVVGGISASVTTFNGSPNWLGQLTTVSSALYLVGIGATSGVARAHQIGNVTSTITRNTEGVAISNATNVGTTVTITTATAHGRTTGNVISLWGFAPSTYNAESVAITVTGATTFTYVAAVAPAVSPATTFGMYSRDGTSSVFTTGQVVSGGEFSGVLLVNTSTDGLYYWAGSTAISLRKVVGSYVSEIAVPFGTFVIQLKPTISAVQYPYRICWSTAAEPGSVPSSFTASATNQAGDVDKPEIGELVFAAPLGDDLIVYGTKGRLVMRYVGGNDVFSFTVLPGKEGLSGATTVAVIPSGHIFVDRNCHVRLHSGGVTSDISAGRVQNLLNYAQVYGAVTHLRQSEVWIYYKEASYIGSDEARFALVWNWEEQSWGKVTLSNKKFGICAGSVNSSLYFVGDAAGTLDEYDYAGSASASFSLERSGLDAGDTSVIKNLQRSRWNIDKVALFPSVHTIQHGSSMFADTAPTYATGVTYTPGTSDWLNSRATGGRFMALKWSGTTSVATGDTPYYGIRVRSADIDFTLGGKR